MDALVFSEFAGHLTEMLKKERKKLGENNDSSLELSELLKDGNDNPNQEKRSPSEDDFMRKLNDGNYLESHSPKQSQI